MKYKPEEEVAVFATVKELGEATEEEILEYLKDNFKSKAFPDGLELTKTTVRRYIRRYKAKKIFALNSLDGHWVVKLADIPPWYMSGIMALCKDSDSEEMKMAIEGLDERLKNQGRIIKPRGVWGDYRTFDLTFECLTPILGGRLSGEERTLEFPRNNGQLVIPSSWFHGMFRDNAALIDLPQSITYHLAISNGEFTNKPKTEHIQLKVKTGLVSYEAVSRGSRFNITIRFPFRGSTLKKKQQIIDWLKMIEVAPLRGLGANPKALGGRIKLVKIEG